MDPLALSLVALAALIAGAVAGWAVGSARATSRFARERSDLGARLAAAEATRAGVQAQLDHQQTLYRELAGQTRHDQAAREERERREQTLLRAIAPVRDALDSMQRKVDDLERDRGVQFGAVSEQLRRTAESGEALRATTQALASAMGSGATRGVWGETQLRRVVEAAGLTRHVDFDLQASIVSDAGAGRPDMIVRLPGETAIAVDAKVPLDAYLEAGAIPVTAVGSEAARRSELLVRHAKAVRSHVDALAKKAYWAGIDDSPEFVICFLPSESLLGAALDADPTLLDYAFGRRVALASPVNLWAVLKTVAFAWTQQDVSTEARELLAMGTELYDRIGTLASHADDLRRSIERTIDSYNKFAGSLESRVLVSARKFPGVDATKLDATATPTSIRQPTRRWTAPELIGDADTADEAQGGADIGELRTRLGDIPGDAAGPRRAVESPSPVARHGRE